MTRTSRARIHETAVKRVTCIYAATLADIFAETLQNSRRAGAARLRITVSAPAAMTGETPLAVTVSDDGAGIADPALLLGFGENGWASRASACSRTARASARPSCSPASTRCRSAAPAPDGMAQRTGGRMLRILAHIAAIVALWLVFSFALFLGLQVDALYGNIGIGLTVALAAAYVYFGWLR